MVQSSMIVLSVRCPFHRGMDFTVRLGGMGLTRRLCLNCRPGSIVKFNKYISKLNNARSASVLLNIMPHNCYVIIDLADS